MTREYPTDFRQFITRIDNAKAKAKRALDEPDLEKRHVIMGSYLRDCWQEDNQDMTDTNFTAGIARLKKRIGAMLESTSNQSGPVEQIFPKEEAA